MTLRFNLIPVLSLATALGLSACSSTAVSRVEKERQLEIHTDSCSLNLSMGEYQRAESQALKGLELDSDNFTLTLFLGRALLHQGGAQRILQAEYALRQLDADVDFRVPLSLAEALERKGTALTEAADGVESGERFTEAPDPVARAVELREDAIECYLEALELFDDALDMRPSDTEVINGLVRITAILEQYEDSLAWGQALVRITKTDRLWFQDQANRTGISTYDEKRHWDVINRLRNLEMSVHLHSASVLNLKLHRTLDAIHELDAVIVFDPNVAEVHSLRAQLLVKMGRYEEAIASLDSYISLAVLSFEHPDIQRAFRIRRDCETALVRATD
ncbi:MAG: tetratricopeptide (TPR) repeat protein [Planctomycetota bacterium]|jgi:tetratricopeptide (TPR) repeat protein